MPTFRQLFIIIHYAGRVEKSMENFVISPDGSCIAFLGESGYINLVSIKVETFSNFLLLENFLVNIWKFNKASWVRLQLGVLGLV